MRNTRDKVCSSGAYGTTPYSQGMLMISDIKDMCDRLLLVRFAFLCVLENAEMGYHCFKNENISESRGILRYGNTEA